MIPLPLDPDEAAASADAGGAPPARSRVRYGCGSSAPTELTRSRRAGGRHFPTSVLTLSACRRTIDRSGNDAAPKDGGSRRKRAVLSGFLLHPSSSLGGGTLMARHVLFVGE